MPVIIGETNSFENNIFTSKWGLHSLGSFLDKQTFLWNWNHIPNYFSIWIMGIKISKYLGKGKGNIIILFKNWTEKNEWCIKKKWLMHYHLLFVNYRSRSQPKRLAPQPAKKTWFRPDPDLVFTSLAQFFTLFISNSESLDTTRLSMVMSISTMSSLIWKKYFFK